VPSLFRIRGIVLMAPAHDEKSVDKFNIGKTESLQKHHDDDQDSESTRSGSRVGVASSSCPSLSDIIESRSCQIDFADVQSDEQSVEQSIEQSDCQSEVSDMYYLRKLDEHIASSVSSLPSGFVAAQGSFNQDTRCRRAGQIEEGAYGEFEWPEYVPRAHFVKSARKTSHQVSVMEDGTTCSISISMSVVDSEDMRSMMIKYYTAPGTGLPRSLCAIKFFCPAWTRLTSTGNRTCGLERGLERSQSTCLISL